MTIATFLYRYWAKENLIPHHCMLVVLYVAPKKHNWGSNTGFLFLPRLSAAPVFSLGSYSDNVDENVPTVTTVSGITLSASESGGGSVTYSIISSVGPFKLSADGTKVLTNGLAVNFVTQNSYTLTVQAESAGNYGTV